MQKQIIYLSLFTLFAFCCCNNEKKNEVDFSRVDTLNCCGGEEKDYEFESDYEEMENFIVELYDRPIKNYVSTIKVIDSLILLIEMEKNEIKKDLMYTFIETLHYFKGELYYHNGLYENSIEELNYYSGYEKNIGIICNHIKMKDFATAKILLDSLPIGNFCEYAYANYYEIIGRTDLALDMYKKIIENDKTRKHFVHYKLSVERIKELEKKNPKLLTEMYFVTGNPSFDVCDSDDENRAKIFELISQIEEVKNDPECTGTWIYEDPYDNEKNYYWIKVGKGMIAVNFKAKYDFIINQETFEIKFLDTIRKKTMSLDDWRKNGI